jgi:hypothetical protein
MERMWIEVVCRIIVRYCPSICRVVLRRIKDILRVRIFGPDIPQ